MCKVVVEAAKVPKVGKIMADSMGNLLVVGTVVDDVDVLCTLVVLGELVDENSRLVRLVL